MTRRLVAAMVALAAVVAVALAVPLAAIVDGGTRSVFVAELERDTLVVASQLASQPPAGWQSTIDGAAQQTGARVVVVDTQGVLVADTDSTDVDRTFDRPEITAALRGDLASDVRYSQTLAQDLRYVAAPVVQGGAVVAAVRLSLPEAEIAAVVARTRTTLAVFVLSVIVAAALVAWILAASISAPLRTLAHVADDLPEDLGLRAELAGPPEVRAIATALNRTAGRLSALLARQQRVAADASHHLKTPLTGVRLRLEAIDDLSESARIRGEAQAATAEVDRLHRRIDQVLALARADAGTTVGVCDVAAIATQRCREMTPVARERGLTLSLQVESTDLHAQAGGGAVENAVDELIANALDYARTRIEVAVGQVDGAVQVDVVDDGPGIAETERDAVFERFTRGHGAVPGGSGMGLALVRELARASGGDAVAIAAPGGGCLIRVTWPAAAG